MANDPSADIRKTRRYARDVERAFANRQGLRSGGPRGARRGTETIQRVTGRDVMKTRGQNVAAARRRVAATGKSLMNPAVTRPARRK